LALELLISTASLAVEVQSRGKPAQEEEQFFAESFFCKVFSLKE